MTFVLNCNAVSLLACILTMRFMAESPGMQEADKKLYVKRCGFNQAVYNFWSEK
jgi:hypothetical protein